MRFLLLFFLIISTSLQANDGSTQSSSAKISVQASAKVLVKADYMRLNLSIYHQADSVKVAKQEVDKAAKGLFRIFKQFNIAKKDQDASYIRSQTLYRWNNNKREKQGESVSRIIQINLRDMNKLASLTHEILQIKHAHIQSQEFAFDNLSEHQNRALKEAVKQAKIKAKKMLEATNQSLGEAIFIQEQLNGHTPIMYNRMQSEDSSAKQDMAPMYAAKREVTAKVQVTFRIK